MAFHHACLFCEETNGIGLAWKTSPPNAHCTLRLVHTSSLRHSCTTQAIESNPPRRFASLVHFCANYVHVFGLYLASRCELILHKHVEKLKTKVGVKRKRCLHCQSTSPAVNMSTSVPSCGQSARFCFCSVRHLVWFVVF